MRTTQYFVYRWDGDTVEHLTMIADPTTIYTTYELKPCEWSDAYSTTFATNEEAALYADEYGGIVGKCDFDTASSFLCQQDYA